MPTNNTASLKVSLSYEGPGGVTVAPAYSVACPFQSQAVGVIDVPDAEVSTTTHAVDFGAVAKATLVIVVNKTGQDLAVKINGAAAASHNVPDGGAQVFAAAALPAADELASIDLITTATQSGAGSIETFVFGDPA